VFIPSYRQDITLEEDLVEEVARLIGYDSIPSTLPFSNAGGALTQAQQQLEQLRGLNVGLGLYETINYSFISPQEAEKLLTAQTHPWRRPLAIANPLTEEQSVMRLSLLPGLLNCARRNISRRNLDLALFELGSVYDVEAGGGRIEDGKIDDKNFGCDDHNLAQPREIPTWALLLSGFAPASWQGPGAAYDYFYAKGLIEAVVAAFNAGSLNYKRAPAELYPYLHPGRSALVYLGGVELGVLGELDPRVAANYDVAAGTVVAEIWLDPLFKAAQAAISADLPKYPAMERDIALVGSADIEAAAVEEAIRSAAGPLVEQVKLFDIYNGPPIPKGQRSLAYALSFRNTSRTLTDAEADAAMERIVGVVGERWGMRLR
jgi:phenylalanyl-tRNA synthetase beta chain